MLSPGGKGPKPRDRLCLTPFCSQPQSQHGAQHPLRSLLVKQHLKSLTRLVSASKCCLPSRFLSHLGLSNPRPSLSVLLLLWNAHPLPFLMPLRHSGPVSRSPPKCLRVETFLTLQPRLGPSYFCSRPCAEIIVLVLCNISLVFSGLCSELLLLQHPAQMIKSTFVHTEVLILATTRMNPENTAGGGSQTQTTPYMIPLTDCPE